MKNNMKKREVGEGLKEKNIGGMKMVKRDNPEKKTKNPDIAHHNYPPGEPANLIKLARIQSSTSLSLRQRFYFRRNIRIPGKIRWKEQGTMYINTFPGQNPKKRNP